MDSNAFFSTYVRALSEDKIYVS